MSVFTIVRQAELEAFLVAYDLGALVEFSGIEAGIENTNYFVTTTAGRFVLTLFEFTPRDELGYFLDLMAFLADRGVPCPHPLAARDGTYLRSLNGRPAALVRRLEGRSIPEPGTAHCAQIGAALAGLHCAGRDFPRARDNDRGRAWREQVADLVANHLGAEDRALLATVVADDFLDAEADLPRGVIHADLFHDNALFTGERLSGIIDFYYAHTGPLLYDLAVTVADWCFRDGTLDRVRGRALVAAYAAVRPLDANERAAWPAAVRAAGARFWLSRLKDRIFPRDAAMTFIKDPAPFRAVLCAGLERADELAAVWSDD